MKHHARQLAIVFALWTAVALLTAAADFATGWALGRHPGWAVLRRPLTEQWIWAALTPLVFHLARRFPLHGPARRRHYAWHALFFVLLCLLHCGLAEAVGGPLAWLPSQSRLPSGVLRLLEEFYSDIWMYWPLVGLRTLLDLHAREREREHQAHRLERSLDEARLALLRAQIQPHFLFNTLHATSALMRVDARAAEDMLADLAALLRASFADAAAQQTTLAQELELVDAYLRIQQRRLGERLSVLRDIDSAALGLRVPALLLQPLVENAVVHGIATLARPGRVWLTAQLLPDSAELLLVVADDGAGLAAGHRAGVGLANARERLLRLYGPAHGLEISSRPGQGTRIELRLPLQALRNEGTTHDDPHAHRGRRAAGAAEPVVAA